MQHRWISLGAFPFSGTPTVELTNVVKPYAFYEGAFRNQRLTNGEEDVAWDAIAFQPLPGKPRDMVVALGDSYASGEGASAPGGGDYYPETDNNGADPEIRNACHRSRNAWSRRATLTGAPGPIGSMADGFHPDLDYHLLACSGAETENLLPSGPPGGRNEWGQYAVGQWNEVSQLDKGYLDEHTTLVTLAVGGNDARFGAVITTCYLPGPVSCPDAVLSTGEHQDTQPLRIAQQAVVQQKVIPSMRTVLRAIHTLAPNARIMLMGYPRLLEGNADCLASVVVGDPPQHVVDLDPDEVAWLNDVADALAANMTILTAEERARGLPVWFSDPRDEFAGEGVCGSPQTIHGIVNRKTPGDHPNVLVQPTSAQSFHPDNSGTVNYAEAMNQTLREMGE
jgi:hypothetical protein